jgi:LPS export ABC transporter protein LptC
VACSGEEAPPTARTAADTADQIIFGLTHNLTEEGVPKAKLEADTAYFYQQSQVADLRHIHVTFYAADGSVASRLTAILGKYEWRTGDMHAMDSVVAVTPDGRRLTTSMLNYKRGSNEISGPERFVFDAPGRHLEGDAFTSDPDFKNVVATHPRKGNLGKVELGH